MVRRVVVVAGKIMFQIWFRISARHAFPLRKGTRIPTKETRLKETSIPFKKTRIPLREPRIPPIWPPKPRPSRRFFRCAAVICGRKGLKQWMDPAAAVKEGLAEAVTILRTVDS